MSRSSALRQKLRELGANRGGRCLARPPRRSRMMRANTPRRVRGGCVDSARRRPALGQSAFI